MKTDVTVIAFDIDGTLYPAWRLYVRVIPYFISHLGFFLHYNRVRKILHCTAPLPDFFEYQSRLLALELDCTVDEAKGKIKTIIYDGLRPYFNRIKPFKGMTETVSAFKNAGYKIALLSDFPPAQKGGIWGVVPYCDLIIGTEDIGALKPSLYPFGIMARLLDVPQNKILYVGNSVKYDVKGAKAAGMQAAYLLPLWRRVLHCPLKQADICFSNYRQLKDIVLQ